MHIDERTIKELYDKQATLIIKGEDSVQNLSELIEFAYYMGRLNTFSCIGREGTNTELREKIVREFVILNQKIN